MGKRISIKIGAGWRKEGVSSKTGKPYKFISISMCGKQEKDEYEVILRRKSDGQELPLFITGVTMNENSYKKEGDKQPDFVLQTSFESQEE